MRLNELTITQASASLKKKEFSVTELVASCIAAIEEKDPEVHAYLDIFDDALAHAKRADTMLHDSHEPLGPLFGIPLAIKDNILIKGKRATAGSKILEHYVAPYDATVITKLKNAGAIFLGKTNLDEFAMGSSTENSAFGATKNPHDVSRVPGGSSGGSAAAVASHLCLAALGSDTGGSIRQPASFCGIVGMKPTYGAVSRHGLIAMSSSLDQIGPMTKSVEDASLLFHAIAGEDALDSTSLNHAWDEKSALPKTLKDVRVGVPKEYFAAGLDAQVKQAIESGLAKIEHAGARIKEISLPHSSQALPAYYIIAPSEISSNMARFDGIRYGLHAKNAKTLLDTYRHSRAHGLGAEVKRRILIGTYALSAGYYDAYYVKAQKVRRLIRNDFEQAFEKVEFIISPTTPTPAFALGERTKDPLEMYLADMYTVAANLAGIPALSLPAGSLIQEGKKLPVGLQIIANHSKENDLFSFSQSVVSILKITS